MEGSRVPTTFVLTCELHNHALNQPSPCNKYAGNAARCFVRRLALLRLRPHSTQPGGDTQQVSSRAHCSVSPLLLPPGPHHSHCQAVLLTALIFCLFFVASSQPCSSLVSLLLVSLSKSLLVLLAKTGWELSVTIYVFL